jgi:hypothetical protein
MEFPLQKYLAVAVCLVLATVPARATSNHQYAKGEYGIIRGGLAPNKQVSLASRGEGELGDEDFHVWLMAEPAHRKIVKLDDISSDNNLDTDPEAYHASWSKDSRHVGVAFRSSRHEVTLNLYNVEGRRISLIAGPDLFKEVAHRDVTDSDDLRQRIAIVEWHAGSGFLLKEFRSFVVSDDSLAKLLGSYGRVAEKMDDGKLLVQFFVEAECELLPSNRFRIVGLRPGKPGDSETWGQ